VWRADILPVADEAVADRRDVVIISIECQPKTVTPVYREEVVLVRDAMDRANVADQGASDDLTHTEDSTKEVFEVARSSYAMARLLELLIKTPHVSEELINCSNGPAPA